MESLVLRFLDHTQWRTTVGRTSLDEWSALRRDLYLTTHNTHNRNIHVSGGIGTHNLSRREAADLRIRLRGHWDRRMDKFRKGYCSLQRSGIVYKPVSMWAYSSIILCKSIIVFFMVSFFISRLYFYGREWSTSQLYFPSSSKIFRPT
jgi:hypothetical protein